ncbi:hypothetical protein HK096_007197 [Nowakowskiella sp. JEL0078]|nr:hypothetical protein HK096_007197 [Nowakowskiella sp. JEL0078]
MQESISYERYADALEKINDLSGMIISLHKDLDQAKEEIERLKRITHIGNKVPRVFWIDDTPQFNLPVSDEGKIDNLLQDEFHQNNDCVMETAENLQNSNQHGPLIPWPVLLQKYFPEHIDSADQSSFEKCVQIFLEENFGKDRAQSFRVPLNKDGENSGAVQNKGNQRTLQYAVPLKISNDFFNWCKARNYIFGTERYGIGTTGTQSKLKISKKILVNNSPKPLRKRGRPSNKSKMLEAESVFTTQQIAENYRDTTSPLSPVDDPNDPDFTEKKSKKAAVDGQQNCKRERISDLVKEISLKQDMQSNRRVVENASLTKTDGKIPKRSASMYSESSVHAVSIFEKYDGYQRNSNLSINLSKNKTNDTFQQGYPANIENQNSNKFHEEITDLRTDSDITMIERKMNGGTPCSSCGKKTNVFKINPSGGCLICWSCFQRLTENKNTVNSEEQPISDAKIEPIQYSILIQSLIPEFDQFPKNSQNHVGSMVKTWILKNSPERFSECVITVNDHNTYGIPIDMQDSFMKWAKEQSFDRVPGLFLNDITGNLKNEYYIKRGLTLPPHYNQIPQSHVRNLSSSFDSNSLYSSQYQNVPDYQPSSYSPTTHFFKGQPLTTQFHRPPLNSFGAFNESGYPIEIQQAAPRFDGFRNEYFPSSSPVGPPVSSQDEFVNQKEQFNK